MSMSTQFQQLNSNLNINNLDINLKNKNNNNDYFNKNEEFYLKYASIYNGIYCQKKVMYSENIKNNFKFVCANKHKFNLTIDEIEDSIWCKVCTKKYEKLEELVNNKKGKLINKNPFINNFYIKCKFSHIFKIDIKNLNTIKWQWCHECKVKKDRKPEETTTQEELLNKINKKYSESYLSSSYSGWDKQVIKNNAALEFVNGNFLKTIGINLINPDKDITGSNSLSICKKQELLLSNFILLDSFLVKQHLQRYSMPWKKNLFRTCCLLLHPDKNNNKASKEAFIKLLYCFKKN